MREQGKCWPGATCAVSGCLTKDYNTTKTAFRSREEGILKWESKCTERKQSTSNSDCCSNGDWQQWWRLSNLSAVNLSSHSCLGIQTIRAASVLSYTESVILFHCIKNLKLRGGPDYTSCCSGLTVCQRIWKDFYEPLQSSFQINSWNVFTNISELSVQIVEKLEAQKGYLMNTGL